uniref:Starch synthase, chloroplastic/amyloplastic n=1 Tax=Pyramimonas obovata TaxID=1411642 RepID=A0A7S0MWB4_9CHLO
MSTVRAPIVSRVGNTEKQSASRVLSPAQFARAARTATLSSRVNVQPLLATRNARRATVRALANQIVAEATKETAVKKADKPMNIVFVSTEVAPWSKTGGLGDVVGSLPEELVKRGHKVMSVSPRYDQYKGAWDTSVTTNVIGEDIRFFHEKKKGVDRVFVDSPLFLAKVWGKTGSKLYGLKSGSDFENNAKRFAVLNHAAFEAQKLLPFGYGEDVVFVANDWHTGLAPVILKTVYQAKGEFTKAKCAFVVHNIAFQGRFWYEEGALAELGIPEEAHSKFYFEDGYPTVFSENTPAEEDEIAPKKVGGTFKKFNWMKAAFNFADKNLTVSPNYAEEIMSGADKGVEMDEIINEVGGIEGILNGMDPAEWNPSKDKYLDMPYDEETVTEGKAAAKASLQAEAGLPVDPTAPLFGYIGRLEEQKGVDIMLKAVQKLGPDAQVIILGTGKAKYEKVLKTLKGNAVGVAKFSAPLAHMINAGADFLLVPSRFEPCGLIQLHAMAYGTVPVVSSTGGLVDTVKEGVTGFHIGAMDPDELVEEDVDAMVATIERACVVYKTPAYPAMVKACIGQDLTWKEPAKKWEGVLEELFFGKAESSTTKKEAVQKPTEKVDFSVNA